MRVTAVLVCREQFSGAEEAFAINLVASIRGHCSTLYESSSTSFSLNLLLKLIKPLENVALTGNSKLKLNYC